MMEGGGWVAMVMRVEHARSPRGCTPSEETWRKDGKVGEEKRSAVLPVAVGHGILSLLLLEELCDGQQLFQHMLLCAPLIAQRPELV